MKISLLLLLISSLLIAIRLTDGDGTRRRSKTRPIPH